MRITENDLYLFRTSYRKKDRNGEQGCSLHEERPSFGCFAGFKMDSKSFLTSPCSTTKIDTRPAKTQPVDIHLSQSIPGISDEETIKKRGSYDRNPNPNGFRFIALSSRSNIQIPKSSKTQPVDIHRSQSIPGAFEKTGPMERTKMKGVANPKSKVWCYLAFRGHHFPQTHTIKTYRDHSIPRMLEVAVK